MYFLDLFFYDYENNNFFHFNFYKIYINNISYKIDLYST